LFTFGVADILPKKEEAISAFILNLVGTVLYTAGHN
jgi:hypothetical protein